jgi:hypothetical protein
MVMGKRTIRCTPENAKAFQDLVKADADLHSLVQQLQAQTGPDGRSMFPGLRAMSITITGDETTLAKGLGAWPVKNGSEAGKSEE